MEGFVGSARGDEEADWFPSGDVGLCTCSLGDLGCCAFGEYRRRSNGDVGRVRLLAALIEIFPGSIDRGMDKWIWYVPDFTDMLGS